MKPRPDGAVLAHRHAVPHDVEMLPSVPDMLHDHMLVLAFLVPELALAAGDDLEHLFVRQPFVFARIDADMMQRLFGLGRAGDFPHLLKGRVQIGYVRIADPDGTNLLVLPDGFQIACRSPVPAPNMAFDNQGCGRP